MKNIFKISGFAAIIGITLIALTSGTSKEYNSDGGYKDLVEELYAQAVKQDNNLGSIEDDIEKFYKKKEEAVEKYNSFVSYNNRYYSDARSNTGTIGDASYKQRAADLILKSENSFKTKLTDWQDAINSLNTNEKMLSDLHTFLKIIITMPMIEKYQATAFPDDGKLKDVNKELQELIDKIKAITK
jgi:hypothetical protein